MGWILAIDCGSTATTAAIDDGNLSLLEIDGTTRLPSELARILDAARHRQGGSEPDEVVLTHPAQWTDEQIAQLLETAGRAGIPDVTTLSEPVAAAIHVVDDGIAVGDHVAVCDLGGGTLDVALLRRSAESFDLVGQSTDDEQLGGDEFDGRLYRHVGEILSTRGAAVWHRLRSSDEPEWARAREALHAEVRRAKETLSTATESTISVGPPVDQAVRVTRSDFEALVRPDLERTATRLVDSIAAAGLERSDVRAVYLVGDSSHIPLARQLIGEATGLTPIVGADPKSAVALGAATRQIDRQPLAVPIIVPRTEKAAEPTAPVAAVASVVAAGSSPTTGARFGTSSARKVALATGAAVIFVALVTTVMVTRSGNDVASTAVSSSGAPTTTAVADGTLEHAFATTLYGGLRMARMWTYAPDGKLLASQVVATNPGAETQSTAWHEVVPKEVAVDVGLLTFDPAPDAIVERDPVVRYDLKLEPGESATMRWSAPLVEGIDSAEELAALAAKRDDAEMVFLASRSTTTTAPSNATTSTTARNSSTATTQAAPGATTVPSTSSTVAPTTAPTTIDAPVSAPGLLRSLRVSDPIATRSANGIPEEIQVTLDWAPPVDDGGQAPTSYKIRCTLMQGIGSKSTVFTPPAGSNQDCVGGVDVAKADGAAHSTTVITKRVDSGPATWLKWEVSAVNRGGTGPPLTATVIVPNIVGRFVWEAYPLSRAVGLSTTKATARECTTDSVICKQGIAANTTSDSGAEFLAFEKPPK